MNEMIFFLSPSKFAQNMASRFVFLGYIGYQLKHISTTKTLSHLHSKPYCPRSLLLTEILRDFVLRLSGAPSSTQTAQIFN